MDELQEAAPPGDAAEPSPASPSTANWRIVYTTRTAEIADVYSLNDGGHNKFLVLFELIGNDTPITVIKYNPAGIEVARWVERPPQGAAAVYKANALNVCLSGADLEIWICGHEAVSGERNNSAMVWRLVGVAVPYPAGQEPRGAGFNTDLLGGGDPAPAPGLTKEDAKAAMREVLMEVLGAANVGQIFNRLGVAAGTGVYNRRGDLLTGLLTLADLQRALAADGLLYHSDGLFNRLMETQYQVVRDNKIIAAAYKILDLPPPPAPGTPEPPPA